MIAPPILKKMNRLFDEAERIKINDWDKIVIFSDLHMGNGGPNDDFKKNSELFLRILKDYYLDRNFKLILNGDIEELYKFSLKTVEEKWKEFYDIIAAFEAKSNVYKILGNHDHRLTLYLSAAQKKKLLKSLRLEYGDNSIFIYHGHQTAGILEQYSRFVFFMVKYLFRAVKNGLLPIDNGKKYKTEKVAYEFSKNKKIMSILGHTHRPLFESLSRIDSLKLLLEILIDKYQDATEAQKLKIENQIKVYKTELYATLLKDKDKLKSAVYNSDILVPCLFNTGAVTGKRGITGIEIKKGKIYLIYWFDISRSKRYLHYKNVKTKAFKNTDYYKAVLKSERLDYIFSRINLLG